MAEQANRGAVDAVPVAGDAVSSRGATEGAVASCASRRGIVEPHQFPQKLLFSQRGRALPSV